LKSLCLVIPEASQRLSGTQEMKKRCAGRPLGPGSALRFGRDDTVWV